jgi:hypothetical protein
VAARLAAIKMGIKDFFLSRQGIDPAVQSQATISKTKTHRGDSEKLKDRK